jgi:hypothetical protein
MACVRLHGNLDALVGALADQSNIAVNKARKRLNPVQNRFNFQLDKLAFRFDYSQPIETSIGEPKASFFLLLLGAHAFQAFARMLPWTRDPGDRALQECNLSTGSPMDCGRIRPVRTSKPGPGLGHRDHRKPCPKAKNSPRVMGKTDLLLSKIQDKVSNYTNFTHRFCYRTSIRNRLTPP